MSRPVQEGIEFGLLGPLEVDAGDGPLPLGGAKQRALLTLLVLNANRVVPRDRLIDELWSGDPPETAVKAVQVYVSQLRKLLPGGMLETRPGGYVLRVEPESIDVLRFERLLAAAGEAEPRAASALLREALGLWRGPALAGLGEQSFAQLEAARLEELRLAALDERIEADLALGGHAGVIGELEALVARHPHRERPRRQLMVALYRSGRQAEALEAYRSAWTDLGELGLEPSAALRELEKQILGQDRSLDLRSERLVPGRVVLPGALVPSPPFPFVGRRQELAALRVRLDRAEGGEGGVVLLAGEAGSGKTRLVRELAHEAARRGVLVLYGVSDAAVTTPYQPLREWFEFLLSACEPLALQQCLEDSGPLLSRLVPALARLSLKDGMSEPVTPEPELDRYVLQSAVVDALRCLSRIQPLLVVADDAHWADSETLQLLRRLARAAPEGRILLVAGLRDRGERRRPELEEMLAELSRLDAVTRMALAGLSAAEVGAFIRCAGHAKAPPELVAAVGELTGGTPLLLSELWRDLLERGDLEVSEAGVRLRRPLEQVRGPERLRDIVLHRLSRLAPETAALLELAAVAGSRFEPNVLGDAAGLEPAALASGLDEAGEHGMIEELPDPAPACRFTHELVRRAVYDRIEGIRRARLHLRIGEALERAHGADPTRVLTELAHHFTIAAPVAGTARGVGYNCDAADAASAAAALDEAIARLTTALELGIADPSERVRVQGKLGYLLTETGRVAEGDAMWTSSIEDGARFGELGPATHVLVERTLTRGSRDPGFDSSEMRRIAEEAIATFTELGDSLGLALAERLLAIALGGQGRLQERREALERALSHADAAGDPTTRRRVIVSLASTFWNDPTPVGEAIARCEELRDSGRSDRVLEASLNRCLALLHAMAGRADEARELVRASSLVLDELNHRTHSSNYREIAVDVKELVGDRPGIEQELLAMLQYLRDHRAGAHDRKEAAVAFRLAGFYCDEGRWEDAERLLGQGRDVPLSDADSRGADAGRLAVEARVAAHDGRLTEAVTLAEAAVARSERSENPNYKARILLVLAAVQRAAGLVEEADGALAKALDLYEQKGNVAAAARARAAAQSP